MARLEEAKVFTFVYDNEDIILEYRTKTDDGKPKTEMTRYIHGPGIDEPLAIERKYEVYYYHADGLGSITALTDKKQKVVESYTYSSFGEIKQNGDKVKNAFTFTGREWDKETDLYYYRARYYDAKMGRFISRDPIGFEGGMNLYGYVNNLPTTLVDPFGTECQVNVYRTEALMSSGINAGHEWIVYGWQSVGFWPNRDWQVLRPDPAEVYGVPKVYRWDTIKLESGELLWGSGTGKECKCASCDDIHSCLNSAPNPGWTSFSIVNNCRRFVQWALPGCCLNKN